MLIILVITIIIFIYLFCLTNLSEQYADPVTLAPQSKPKVMQIDDFLSAEECQHIINQCRSNFNRSGVMKNDGGTTKGKIRTSSSCFLGESTTTTIREVEQRAAELSGQTVDQIEGMQVVRYYPGQKYDAHNDWFHHKHITNNRYITILVYLNDNFEGGQTDFVKLDLSAKPKQGRAIMWYNCEQNDVDKCYQEAMHRGSPPTKGVKYALNIWIRFNKYRNGGQK